MQNMLRAMLMAGIQLFVLAGAPPLAAQVAITDSTSIADPHEMPAEGTLVRFWASGWSNGPWQFGRVGTIRDSYRIFCPIVDVGADGLSYLVASIDSLQVVDSSAARAGKPIFRPVDMSPIKARYGTCGVPR